MRLLFLTLVLFSLALTTNAATLLASPRFPSPEEKVKVSINLENGEYPDKILWYKDDKLLDSNGKEIIIDAPGLGEVVKIKTFINFKNKKALILEKEIKSSEIDLLWESQTYTHPIFRLAAFPSSGSLVKFKAFVKIPGEKERDILFVWKKDGEELRGLSGLSKNYAEIKSNYFSNDFIVTLELYDSKNFKLLSSKSVLVKVKEPEIDFYLKDKLLGWIFEKTLANTLYLNNKEEILAMPFNFDISGVFDNVLSWSWLVDGTQINPQKANSPYVEISFISKDKNKAILRAEARHKEKDLQNAYRELQIKRSGNNRVRAADTNDEAGDKSGFGI